MNSHLLLGMLLVAASVSASAASLMVRPTTIILAKGESASTLTVTNSGAQPVTAQLRIYGWTQDQNQDRLEQSASVVASPPMVTVPAGQSQTVRLVRVISTPARAEESYRLIVDEIVDRKAQEAAPGVAIALRYSVPVFVMPNPGEPARATVKASLAADSLVLDVANRGKSHAQISNVTLGYADGTSQVLNGGLVGYVLPDEQRQWKLQLPSAHAATAPKRVRALVNGKELLVAL
jgi:fimbrial chaperone protein